jgi:hypothetical protein
MYKIQKGTFFAKNVTSVEQEKSCHLFLHEKGDEVSTKKAIEIEAKCTGLVQILVRAKHNEHN